MVSNSDFLITTLSLMFTVIIAYLITEIMPKKSFIPKNWTGQAHFHKLLIILIIIALGDFYFVSLFPVVSRFEEEQLRYATLIVFLILTVISTMLILEIRSIVLEIKTTQIKRNEVFLKLSFSLILTQKVIIFIFYLVALIALGFDVATLPGEPFIFDIDEVTETAEIRSFENSDRIMLLFLTGIKGAFLIIHHFSLFFIFTTLFVIFYEWNSRVKETPINFFMIFSFGFIIQGIGQVIQSIGLFYAPFFLTSSGKVSKYISAPVAVGSFIVLLGSIIYFFAFMMASLTLLRNISHMVLPVWLQNICKIGVVIIPILYTTLYTVLAILNIAWLLDIGDIEKLSKDLEWLTHIVDFPAMILLPLSCGLFFLVAYIQGRSKEKSQELGSFVLWTFLSLFLVFGAGNNTMSSLSYFGMLHGPLALLGALLLMYGLSRVADHASRHRRVIRHIRQNPEDFAFLAKLGEGERKTQIWAKVDSLVKTGVIKPIVPTETPDETKAAAEVNSYMAEITKTFDRRARRRRVPSTS